MSSILNIKNVNKNFGKISVLNDIDINIDKGLYFGKKNSYTDNQNIFVTGVSNNQVESISWQITKL